MRLYLIAWKNLWIKPLTTVLTLILFALGVGLLTMLLLVNSQIKNQLESNLAEIDLVIGAKGSPLQMILSSMYHIDAPTGNIEISEAKAFLNPKHPLIEMAVPVSIGDNYKSKRIVGTTHQFPDLYEAKIFKGEIWKKDYEVCIGKAVSDELKLKIGDRFYSSHGFEDWDDLKHDDGSPFRVVGIFHKTGSVLDQLILTNTSSIWGVHSHGKNETEHDLDHDHEHNLHTADEHEHHHNDPAEHIGNYDIRNLMLREDQEISSVLIRYKNNNFQTLNLPRFINENTDLQAASPPYEINRVYAMLGTGTAVLKVLAIAMALVSALSIFFSLYNSLSDRKYELAMMRVLGASRLKLLTLIVLEGLFITLLACILGLMLGHLFTELFATKFSSQFKYSMTGWKWNTLEWIIIASALFIGLLASLLPAIKAYRLSIHNTLSTN